MAQPAGEQRGGRQPHRIVRVLRTGNGHQPLCRSISRTSTACPRLAPIDPTAYTGGTPDVDQHDARPAAGRRRIRCRTTSADRPRRRSRPPDNATARRASGELLRRQPGRRRRQRDRQRRLQRLPRAAAGAEAPAVARAAGERQLPVRDRGRIRSSSASATAAR